MKKNRCLDCHCEYASGADRLWTAGHPKRLSGTMTELVEGIYRNCTQQPEFALGDPTPIDTSDAFALQSYLGLTDASLVQEAVFSEPMINAQAYSLCALRVAEGKNPKDVAQSVLDGVDPRKWICVEADQVRVGGMGRHSSAGYGQQRSGSQSG